MKLFFICMTTRPATRDPQVYLWCLFVVSCQNKFNCWICKSVSYTFSIGATVLQWAKTSLFTRFLDHTQRRTTVGRTPLDEWSSRRRDLYLTTHNNHKRKPSMSLVGFEPTTPAGGRPQTYASDRAATGIGHTFSRTVNEDGYFPESSHREQFREPRSSGSKVAPIPQVLASVVLSLLENTWVLINP
jgi:hypothetical protein